MNIPYGKSSVRSLGATLDHVTALLSAILHIVSLCAKKEMFRIDTAPDIAAMQNLQSIWNRTDESNIRYTMSQALWGWKVENANG